MKPFIFGPIQTAWLKSLKEHPERQLKGSLGEKYPDGTYKACCLGEAGLIAGVCEWITTGNRTLLAVGAYYEGDKLSVLIGQSYGAIGLFGPGGEKSYDNKSQSLANLNDGGKTWPEIAAIIEADPWAYLTEPK